MPEVPVVYRPGIAAPTSLQLPTVDLSRPFMPPTPTAVAIRRRETPS